jgi:hypothetical protein
VSEPPSAEPSNFPQYCAIMVDPVGQLVTKIPIVAPSDDEAKVKAQALVDGHAVDLWDSFRFIKRFEPG